MRTILRSLLSSALIGGLLTLTAQAAPLGFADLEVWLDAHDELTLFSDTAGTISAADGAAVRRWNDKSGNNRDAVADTVGSPTRNDIELNGRPSVKYAGAGQSLDITGAFTSPYTIFTVDEYTGGLGGHLVQAESTNWLLGKWSGSVRFHVDSVGFVDANTDGLQGAGPNVPIISVGMADTGLNRSFYFRNGASMTAGTPTAGLAPGPIEIGASAGPGGGEASNAAIGEFIAYSRALNSAERTIVNNYLSSKHLVTLTTGLGALDVYSGDTLANGDYDYGVFGFGRVDASNIAPTSYSEGFSLAEANSTLDVDNEWLMAGHDGTTNAIIALEGSDPYAQEPMTGSRWERVWYVDKTGALDATLEFDFEDSGLTAPTGSNTFHLLYSADSDFSNGWTILDDTSLIVGGTVSFEVANGQLLDGYYTLAVNIISVPEPATCTLFCVGIAGITWNVRRRRRRVLGATEA